MTADIYKEPTYKLRVTTHPAYPQPVKPNENLDKIVDEVMQKRYGTELKHFTPKKEQKLRREAAQSLMEKPNFESELQILLPLAKAQGLTTAVQERLKKITDKDLTPVIEFLFSDYKEENFGFLLAAKLVTLLGRGAKNEALRDEVFVEVCRIRRELKKLTNTTSTVDHRRPVVIENLDPNEPTAALFKHYKTLDLDDKVKTLIDACFAKLERASLNEKIIIRAFIAELLDVPYQVQITGTKDAATRAAMVGAIKKGIHNWLKLETWKNEGALKLPEPDVFLNQFFTSNIFREYAEAALFEALPATTSFSGVLDGKLYTPSRGFDFNTSLFDTPFPVLPLTGRHLKSATVIKRLIDTTILAFTALVLTTLYISFFPIVLGVLYYQHRENVWKEAKHILVSLILMPVHLGMSKNWIDLNSEKQLVRQHLKPQTAPELQAIFDRIDNTLLHFVKTGEGKVDEELLRTLAHHWNHLSDAPSHVQKLVQAASSSPVLLFQLLTKFSRESITQAIEENPPLWPAENSASDLVRFPPVNGIIPSFTQDYDRLHHIVQEKYRNYDLPNGIDNEKMERMHEALHDISAIRGPGIPYAIQASLTQGIGNAMTPILNMIFDSLRTSEILPPVPDPIIVVEEGDDSHFWLTVTATSVFNNAEDVKPSMTFHYSYRLKISKSPDGEWSTEFASLTPSRFEILEGGMKPLLTTVSPTNMHVLLQDKRRETRVDNQKSGCEALAEWTPASVVTFKQLEQETLRHVQKLDPAATRKMIQTIKSHADKAKTPQGKQALLHLKSFYEQDHYTKEMKYSYVIDSLKKIAPPIRTDEKSVELYKFIHAAYTDARKHYQTFVQMLREGLQHDPENAWLKNVALHRFAGIRLDQYCQGLVEMATGSFDEPLTLNNFREELDRRNRLAHSLPSKHSISRVTRGWQSLKGVMGIKFDPSAKFNVPYVYGDLNLDGRKITMLRHGVPISHHNPAGFLQRLFGRKQSIPEVTPDYFAFKDQAPGNILQIVLENGDTHVFDSESPRVQARLALHGNNLYAIALRMNGDFVEPKSYMPKTLTQTKAALREQMLGTFEKTRFSLPDNIGNKEQLIDAAMNLVEQFYFSGYNDKQLTQAEFQSFIFLTYADLTLKLCRELNIRYLEAPCKDDIDRGGAFKAILKLHALHLDANDNVLSPEETSKKLQEIMVSLIAAPIIVAKRGIVDERIKFVRNVVAQIPDIEN